MCMCACVHEKEKKREREGEQKKEGGRKDILIMVDSYMLISLSVLLLLLHVVSVYIALGSTAWLYILSTESYDEKKNGAVPSIGMH